MSETTPDPADVHTGTDRVELTDAEKWLIPHLTQLDAAADARDVYAAVGSIVAARVQALADERDRLRVDTNINADEVERQRRLLDLARAELAAANTRAKDADEWQARMVLAHKALEAERDALQATLDRVVALADSLDSARNWNLDHDKGEGELSLGYVVRSIRAALTPEGKP